MAQKCAFEAAVDDLKAATVHLGDGQEFDIAAALKDGKIVLDTEKDQQLISALNIHPAVKPTAVKKGS